MNKKRDILSDILTWFLIVICVFSLWACGFLIGQKTREIDSNTPNIVLNEKRLNDNNLDYFTPSQSNIYCTFITASTTITPNQFIFGVRSSFYANLDFDTTTFYGLNFYCEITLSSVQRYYNNRNISFNFNAAAIQTFDFALDYEISLEDFTSISIFAYVSEISGDEIETTCEIYIDDEYYEEKYFYYVMPTSSYSVAQIIDTSTSTVLLNKDILDNYTLGYDRGYYDGKLDGYDEGYYDKEDEYNATDSAFQKVWNIISNAFASVFNVFNIELFSGIKLFHILAIPLIISVLYFVIKILAK